MLHAVAAAELALEPRAHQSRRGAQVVGLLAGPRRLKPPLDLQRVTLQALDRRRALRRGSAASDSRGACDRRDDGGRLAAREQRVAPFLEQQPHDDDERHADRREHRGEQSAEQRVGNESAHHVGCLSTGTPMM